MNRFPLWAEANERGETVYQLSCRKGSGVDQIDILWCHEKNTYKAVALLEGEHIRPDVAFKCDVSISNGMFCIAAILPHVSHYEPDRLLDAIGNVADLPPGLRAALIQDRNRAKLARRPVPHTPDEDRRRLAKQWHRYQSAECRRLRADPSSTDHERYLQRRRLHATGEAFYEVHATRRECVTDDEFPF